MAVAATKSLDLTNIRYGGIIANPPMPQLEKPDRPPSVLLQYYPLRWINRIF